MKQVGYFNRTRYWQIYAFNNPPKGYKYKRGINIPFHSIGIDDPFLRHTKMVIPYQNIDLFHSYNAIVTGSKPWVVEVESKIPRFGNLDESDIRYRWAIKKLNSEACRAIIFTSKSTRDMNQENFERWQIDKDKCHLVYRAVETHKPFKYQEKDKKFTILFVGNGFYRKGGLELIKAFSMFNRNDVRLVIISSFEVDWEIYPTEEEKKFVRRELEQNNKIEVYKNLSHSEVINWMRSSDVFVSTTHDDPFNNSILEALACGVPAITSDVRAIPEFVQDGWNGFTYPIGSHNREKMVEFILEKMYAYYDDSALLAKHGDNALKMVKSKFTLQHRNNYLKENIYNSV